MRGPSLVLILGYTDIGAFSTKKQTHNANAFLKLFLLRIFFPPLVRRSSVSFFL